MTDRSARVVAVVITTPLLGPRYGALRKELAIAVMSRTSDDLVPPPTGSGPANQASPSRRYLHMLRRYGRTGVQNPYYPRPGRPGIMGTWHPTRTTARSRSGSMCWATGGRR